MRKNPYGPFAETVAAYQRATRPHVCIEEEAQGAAKRAGVKPHNGHHCWNCWNVSLWISNDEGLYLLALECIREPRANDKPVSANLAALRFASRSGLTHTPDGARYSHNSVRKALAGLMED